MMRVHGMSHKRCFAVRKNEHDAFLLFSCSDERYGCYGTDF
jgi:hypothetical protein